MPEKQTLARARADKRRGKAASTQAGEFIKEEMDHIREGVHGARSPKQAIAIGLSKARRAGVELPPPSAEKTSATTRKRAARDWARGHGAPAKRAATPKRSRASINALKRESSEAASPESLARQGRESAAARSPQDRRRSARAAARTKGPAGRAASARRAAKTRKLHAPA